jgi:uncharacterized protein YcbK (DUF882 family)
MRLTEHFVLAEFDSRDGEKVPSAAVDELRELCRRYLEPVRRRFGATVILSGHRSRRHNQRVGGAPRSYHRYDLGGRTGVAADFRCATGSPSQWAAFLEASRPGGMGIYPGFVHVDSRSWRARW